MQRLATRGSGDVSQVRFQIAGQHFDISVPSHEVWGSVKDILLFDEYELLPAFSPASLTGATVLDIGAQVGLYSLKVSPYARRIVSLEPSRRNLRFLKSNLARNRAGNVELREEAIWSSNGNVKFTDAGAGYVSSVGDISTGYDVKTATLDEIIGYLGHVDLMKMDVEGAEYEALLAAKPGTLERIDKIVAEIHVFKQEHPGLFQEILRKLKDSGKSVRVIPIPFQTARDGLVKPWNHTLELVNGINPVAFRLALSGVYAARPIVVNLKRRMEIGSQFLLYAFASSPAER